MWGLQWEVTEERQPSGQAYSGPRPYTLGGSWRLARSSAEACAEALVTEADAPSSRSSLKSQLKTWDQVARDAGFQDPFRLTPNLVFTVVGVLKQAGYRSAVNYLEAAKRVHIESGKSRTKLASSQRGGCFERLKPAMPR